MASIIRTTAVSLRKGDSESNRAFTGILAELVADLGADGTGTDVNTTLRLHNGVLQGGIPMCRADLLNISTSQLAIGRDKIGMAGEKNLAYADLSNLEQLTDGAAIQNVRETLAGYGLAKKTYVDEELNKKANKDFSNIDTADLATSGHGHSGKDLAYADTSNVNTADLTDATIHSGANGNKPLAYADASNIDTSNLEDRLAKIDLTNVSGNSFETALFSTHNTQLKIERTLNKTNADLHTITDASKYPTVPAVKNYVTYEIENAGYLKRDYSNTETYDLLYSNFGARNPQNSNYNVLYAADKSDYSYPTGIVAGGSGFVQGKIYTDSNNTALDTSGAQTDTLKVKILAVDSDDLPTSAEFYQSKGKENIGSGTAQIKTGTSTVNITYTSTDLGNGLYSYTITNVSPVSATGDFIVDSVIEVTPKIALTQLLWMKADTVSSGAITNYSFYPATGTLAINDGTYSFAPNGGTPAQVKLKAVYTAQGGQLTKTDLSNLLGMSEDDKLSEEGRPWRIKADESIPTIQVPEVDIPNSVTTTIATQGQVWELAYDAYQKTMGTAAGRETGGALTDVATYVKRTLDQYALSDTYRGQVLYYLQNESNIGSYTTRPNGNTAIQTGDQILLKQKSDILGGRPYLATATNTSGTITWTYEPFINQDSAQSNGDYVYCLDLGTWDTENYHNASGNITWNHRTQKLDIAPDHDNVPDGVTIVKDNSTGQISLGNFYVPAPEFFNGNGSTTYFTLDSNKCLNGTVPFDVYVDGVFQYPSIAYTFNASNKRITFTNNFAPQTGTSNVAVIYRGVIFTGTATAISSSSVGPKGTVY